MKKLAATAVLLLFSSTALAQSASTREVAATANVPRGEYVFSDHPTCGVSSSAAQIGNDPQAVAAIGKLFGPEAAATVVFISKANKAIENCGGGDACKALRHATQTNDRSSCADMCVSTPAGAQIENVSFSNRSGQARINLTRQQIEAGVDKRSTGDWSGWRNMVAVRDDKERMLVCATATNWSNDRSARKVMRVRYKAQSEGGGGTAASDKSTICRFTSGPRAGQEQDYAPAPAVAIGTPCHDGGPNRGTVVAPDPHRIEPPKQVSTVCHFTNGPRAGQSQDYAPAPAVPVGTPCHDGGESTGTVR